MARPPYRTFAFCFVAVTGCAGGMMGGGQRGPTTRAERSGYLETSQYADVVAFLDSLGGRRELAFGSIGKTSEGRDIPYVVASRPAVSTPGEARKLGRPIVYVQGNIHGGEVEGKEALLALLRDLTNSRRANVLDSIVLIAIPIYNADGNERLASQETNRGSQNGPEMVGQRSNAQGLDLNRDYIKAEAPETRASLAMFNLWDPHVFVDLHTTNGSYHGYALTFAPPLNPAARLGAFTRDSLLPVLRERMRRRHNFETFDYGDFVSEDTLSLGWITFDSRPRFGTNYFGLRGRVAILSEAYSHDPFQRRVASTYAFVREILSLSAERATTLMSARPGGGDSSSEAPVRPVALRSDLMQAPDSVEVIAESVERTGDSIRTEPGVPKGQRRSGRFTSVRMPIFDRFEATLTRRPPAAYAIFPRDTVAVRVLREHGIHSDVTTAPWVDTVEAFRVDSVVVAERPFQGHREVRLVGSWSRTVRTIPRGSFIVNMAQPLLDLGVYLLEPESDDGLATWNFFDSSLRAGLPFPVLRLLRGPPRDSVGVDRD
ncbi:MAG: M14 family metallopeptidase [Gemmatimonadaceae bacterium]|nr:M14 family metallopeptidase [Gemmatimonadaceae bacterium]